jgi:ABC-type transport system involved in cytochrome bd biosynthesis fused ATPase/permease subunit
VIVVLQDGRLVDAGTHHELLERGGHYRALYERQFATDGRVAPVVLAGSAEARAIS